MTNQKTLHCKPSLGFETQHEEATLYHLPITGKIPTWLSGRYISTGPAQFEIGTAQFNHWFDGFAMLKQFKFESGTVSFQNTFLQSQHYLNSHRLKKLSDNAFGTYANTSWFGRVNYAINQLLKKSIYDDNCNVNITCIDKHFIAMTESSQLVEFEVDPLKTLHLFQFDDRIKNQMSTAHPHFDMKRRQAINVAIEIGRTIQYHIYKIDQHSTQRDIICSYISDTLFYMHSFSITSHYIILFKSPLTVNTFKLLLGMPFNDTLFWKNNKSFFIIIDRRDGTLSEIETDSFVCLHSANAYELDNEIILDLICYGEGNPYNSLYLSNLKSNEPHLPHPLLKRYIIDLHSKNSRSTILSTDQNEFPRINYQAINGCDYQFVYTNSITSNYHFFNAIQKFNLRTGSMQRWEKKNYYVGEAIFIANPGSQIEDEGVLLSIALNAKNHYSSLIILDASTMQQLAEIDLPFHLPFGLHGNFYQH
jgi:carotenoid cleavage dioxygenase-like enzyme